VIVILAIERGPLFAARACAGTIVAVVSLAAFALCYAWMAQRFGWLISTLSSWAAYLCTMLGLRFLTIGVALAFLLSCAVLFVAWRWFPRPVALQVRRRAIPGDIALRMALAVVIVWTITAMAASLGPTLSGLLTPFPVAATLLAAFTHHVDGGAASSQLLRSLLAGLYSFALFFLIFGTALTVTGIVWSCVIATAGSLALHALLLPTVEAVGS
jgi:hypothetical protein